MKGFRRLILIIIICMVILTVVADLILIYSNKGDPGRPYRVEAERIEYDIKQGKEINLSGCKYIKNVEKIEKEPKLDSILPKDYFDGDDDYIIKVINGDIYRFDHEIYRNDTLKTSLLVMNICIGVILIFLILVLIYIRIRIIGPFNRMKDLPAELAKGNITAPIEAEKNKYFGEFTWGLDLLREKLEQGKQQDLESKKNNKSLILSISHDIKTPIGIIELNAKALERGLYDKDQEKKNRITGVIKEKCEEITAYVDQIIKASREDFPEMEINNREFYLSSIMDKIYKVYREKMKLLMIDFYIGEYQDCLLAGDPDRAVEVVQNLLENAIKYGDGKEISIGFSREDNSQLISVTNTGCSLKDTELPHIFDSFWRGSNTGSNAGSGLGLYICKQLMNRMNGDIFAEIHEGKMTVTAVFGMA